MAAAERAGPLQLARMAGPRADRLDGCRFARARSHALEPVAAVVDQALAATVRTLV